PPTYFSSTHPTTPPPPPPRNDTQPRRNRADQDRLIALLRCVQREVRRNIGQIRLENRLGFLCAALFLRCRRYRWILNLEFDHAIFARFFFRAQFVVRLRGCVARERLEP